METSLAHWEILKPADAEKASEAISRYTNESAFYLLYENGTALLIKRDLATDEAINGAMVELEFKRDFEVMPMKDGNYTVWLAKSVCVFISKREATEIIRYVRANEEVRIAAGIQDRPMPEDMIIGIAGREKAHRDAKNKNLVYRGEPNA